MPRHGSKGQACRHSSATCVKRRAAQVVFDVFQDVSLRTIAPDKQRRRYRVASVSDPLLLEETFSPESQEAVAQCVRDAYESNTPVYPLGGETSLDYGCSAQMPGIGLSTRGLNRVVDYPSRDMTITVEAGITMESLRRQLEAQRQRLPIDVPQAAQATLGGVLATACDGPRRFGCGTIRDYTIGITAVDGRGTMFRGGGRVVKNVAGYDFCKLLVGSLGTLATIVQVTLKVVPIPEASRFVVQRLNSHAEGEQRVAELLQAEVTPTAIEWLVGPAWNDLPALPSSADDTPAGWLVVAVEGTQTEVDWMTERLVQRLASPTGQQVVQTTSEQTATIWQRLSEFPAAEKHPLVLRATVLSSAVADLIEAFRQYDPQCSIQSHAANGIVLARFSKFEPADIAQQLIARWQPMARQASGHVVVLSADPSLGLTRQAIWGGAGDDWPLMQTVKQQFDPKGLLNPGRFVLP